MKNNGILVLMGTCTSQAMRDRFKGDATANINASMGQFQSGEPYVELFYKQAEDFEKNAALLKGKEVVLVQSAGVPVSENGLHLLMMVDTLKSYGVASVTVVMPFAPFMRQDRKFDKRFVSLGAAFFAKQLKSAGADKVVTIVPHSQDSIKAYQNVFGSDFTVLTTTEMFARDVQKRYGADLDNVMIGAPDGAEKPADEGQRRARELAQAVFGDQADAETLDKHIYKISKIHTDVNVTQISDFIGDVEGKDCIIVDDMCDGGTTGVNAASRLKSKGAKSVTFYFTHPICSGNALEKLLSAKPDGIRYAIDKLVITDTLPDIAEKLAAFRAQHPKSADRVEVLSVADIIFDRIFEKGSKPAVQGSSPKPKQLKP